MFEAWRSEGRGSSVVDVHFGQWVEVTGKRFALVELLGLVDDKADNTNS